MTVCVFPGCGKPLVTQPPASMPRALRPMFTQALAADEFCSRPCAQAFYGVDPKDSAGRPAATAEPRTAPATDKQRQAESHA